MAFWRAWMPSNRASRASIAWARVRSLSDVARVAANRSRSRSGARFHTSLGPVTASESARSMSASSSPLTATAPPLTAVGGGPADGSSLSALGSRPVRPGVMPGGAPAGGQPTWTPPDQVETTGRLATVVSRRPDAPRWALVDEHNNVLAFVAPQAGVNLAPLVGQQVSVRGSKGYMPEYKRPYLVASEARTRIASVPTPQGAAGDRTQ